METLYDKKRKIFPTDEKYIYPEGDVKEFIKKLKEEIKFRKQFGQISEFEVKIIIKNIDELAGDKLI